AAPREADLEDRRSAESKCGAESSAGLQSIEVEVVRFPAHLAELGEHAYAERVQDPALVADLVRHEIGLPEAIVAVAPQEVLIVDVRAAQCRLEIEGNPVPRERVAEDEPAGQVDRSEDLLSVQADADGPPRIEPPERIWPAAQSPVEPVAHACRRGEAVQGVFPRILPRYGDARPHVGGLRAEPGRA